MADAEKKNTELMTPKKAFPFLRRFGLSLVAASVLLVYDAGIFGGFLPFSSVVVCPVWFLISLLKNAIQRPGWSVALARIVVPVLTLGLALGNFALQGKITIANADLIIRASEQFYSANGRYPSKLDELVPRYLQSVPVANHGGRFNKFWYASSEGHHSLMWCGPFPLVTQSYNLERREWHSLETPCITPRPLHGEPSADAGGRNGPGYRGEQVALPPR